MEALGAEKNKLEPLLGRSWEPLGACYNAQTPRIKPDQVVEPESTVVIICLRPVLICLRPCNHLPMFCNHLPTSCNHLPTSVHASAYVLVISKITPKLLQHGSKVAPKLIQHGSQMSSKIDPPASWRALGAVLAAWRSLGGLLERSWSALGRLQALSK